MSHGGTTDSLIESQSRNEAIVNAVQSGEFAGGHSIGRLTRNTAVSVKIRVSHRAGPIVIRAQATLGPVQSWTKKKATPQSSVAFP